MIFWINSVMFIFVKKLEIVCYIIKKKIMFWVLIKRG